MKNEATRVGDRVDWDGARVRRMWSAAYCDNHGDTNTAADGNDRSATHTGVNGDAVRTAANVDAARVRYANHNANPLKDSHTVENLYPIIDADYYAIHDAYEYADT